MKTIRETADHPLRWTRPSMLARQYELTAGPEVVGGLKWESMFGSLATAEAAEGTWTFKRAGFLLILITNQSGLARGYFGRHGSRQLQHRKGQREE